MDLIEYEKRILNLEAMKFELPFEQQSVKYLPSDADLKNYFEHGMTLGKMLKDKQ